MLAVIDILVICKVYKLYVTQPKVIILWLGLECCSILLWLAFICIDQSLLEWQITNFILQAVGLEGFEGDEQGLNMLAVLCGIIYPFIGIGCLFTGLGIINKSVIQINQTDGFLDNGRRSCPYRKYMSGLSNARRRQTDCKPPAAIRTLRFSSSCMSAEPFSTA